METLTAQAFDPVDKASLLAQNMAPAWGSYLYQNVLPSLQTDWLLNGLGASDASSPAPQTNTATPGSDFFAQWSSQLAQPQPMLGQPGPSNYYNFGNFGGSIAPSLLAGSTPSSGPSVMGDQLVASPSPLIASASAHSPPSRSSLVHRRRTRSIDSDAEGEVDPEADSRSQHSHHSEHDSMHEHDEGVERDGMIWGMKVDEYRALSARERKRVRNRISARTFRAKRKEHLSSLESTLGAKDLEIKLAHEENSRLRREMAELKTRLAKYEAPY